MSKEIDKKRCGANVEKVIIDEFVPSKDLDYLDKLLEYKPLTLCERMVMETIKEKVQRLQSIDNANPSEALKGLEHISKEECLFKDRSTIYMGGEKVNSFTWKHTIGEHFKEIESIKQALLKAQEQEKVLEIIKEKNVNLEVLGISNNVNCYNKVIVRYSVCYKELTQEEFDLLRRYFK